MKAIVVGAGAGGLTAAIALRQSGTEATVHEVSPEPAPVGAGLHLWSNALLALRRVGLAEKLRAVSTELEQSLFLTRTGRVMGNWPTGEMGRRLGEPTVGVLRPALQRVLLEGVERRRSCSGLAAWGSSRMPRG